MKNTIALIFAKYPTPGAVNTRLVPPLTHDQAAGLHRACLLATWERLARLGWLDLRLVVTPDDRVEDLCAVVTDGCDRGWPQGRGDLGTRLQRATVRAFGRHADRVLLLGADSPTMPPRLLREATDRLGETDVVLGPCEDGGYYLLGLRRPCPTLFDRIDWGGADVADQTRQRAKEAGVRLSELPVWYDLDRPEDLRPVKRHLTEADLTLAQPRALALRQLIDTLIQETLDG